MRIRDILYTLAILICGTAVSSAQFLLNPYRFAAPVTPVSPGLTNIVAWYDFADDTDADGGTYNLAGQNTPTYTAGPPSYGTATDGTPLAYWQQVALDDNFADIDGDWSMVIRFRGHTSVADNDAVFTSNGGRFRVRWHSTTGINGQAGSATSPQDTITSTVSASLGTWYTVVLVHDTTANTASISVNGETLVTDASITPTYSAATSFFGAVSATDSNNIDIDFAGFYNKVLTQDNIAWLYNSGGTRLYSQL